MSTAPAHFAEIDAAAAREYLLTVAAALGEIAAPGGAAKASEIAGRCSLVLVRLAQQIVPLENEVSQALADEGAVLDRLEDERAALLARVRATKAAQAFDAAALQAWLSAHPQFSASVRLKAAKELTGGRGKRTVLFEVDAADGGEMVLRQDVPSAFPRTSVTFEYPLLRALSAAGIRVPGTIVLEPAAEPLGGPFMIVEKLAGRTTGDLLSPPQNTGLALQLAGQLGRLHALPIAHFAEVPGLVLKDHAEAELRASLAWYRDIYTRYDAPSAAISTAFDWLEAVAGTLDGPVVLLHGDVGFHNMMVDDGAITGLLDWEIAHLGNPAEDVGYCREDVEAMGGWPGFLDAYRAAGGADFSETTLDFHTIFGALKVYCSAVMTREGVVSGRIRDLGITECIIDWVPRLRHRISRRLRMVTAGAG